MEKEGQVNSGSKSVCITTVNGFTQRWRSFERDLGPRNNYDRPYRDVGKVKIPEGK